MDLALDIENGQSLFCAEIVVDFECLVE